MNSNLDISKIFFSYGIALFPLFLLLGPLISEIFLMLIIFFSFFIIFKDKKFEFLLNRFFIFFYFFIYPLFFRQFTIFIILNIQKEEFFILEYLYLHYLYGLF